MRSKRRSLVSGPREKSITEEGENSISSSTSSDSSEIESSKEEPEVFEGTSEGKTTMDGNGQTHHDSLLQSTPKFEKALVARSNELIKEFAPPSMEYSYYVIASPAIGRKVSSTNTSTTTSMCSRSYSFVSMSSRDSSSSEVSAVVQPTKRAPKSRGLLQSVKEKLLMEIENINIELIKMDSERLVLVNLRNASLLYRDMICKSERNHQGIPNASKLRATCESIELKIQDEERAFEDDLAVPSINDIRKDLKEVVKICNVISNNKTSIKMTLVEELLCAVGKLYGVVDTVLVVFYEDFNNKNEVDGLDRSELTSPLSGDEVDNNSTVENVAENLNQSKSSDDDTQNLTIDSFLEKQNDSRDTTSFNQIKAVSQSSPISLEIAGKMEEELKTLQKKLLKAKKLFKGIERLSSGNPKPKSLRACFKDINAMITAELLEELSFPEPWCQVIKKNVVDLQNHLMAERPGERELEHIKIIVGELSGRIATVLKSNMLE